jgi:hypothetical protein
MRTHTVVRTHTYIAILGSVDSVCMCHYLSIKPPLFKVHTVEGVYIAILGSVDSMHFEKGRFDAQVMTHTYT